MFPNKVSLSLSLFAPSLFLSSVLIAASKLALTLAHVCMYASMHTHTHTHTQCNILSFSHQYRAIICFIISKVYLYNDTQLVPTNLTNVLHFISSKFVGYGQHRIIDIYTQLYIYIRLLQFTACRVYPASRSLSGEETHELSTQLRRSFISR